LTAICDCHFDDSRHVFVQGVPVLFWNQGLSAFDRKYDLYEQLGIGICHELCFYDFLMGWAMPNRVDTLMDYYQQNQATPDYIR